jgi:exodeoxyribonuclease VII small subunit
MTVILRTKVSVLREKMNALEAVLTRLESPALDVESALALYTEGQSLLKSLEAALEQAQKEMA